MLTSPRERARETARLAGHADAAVDDDLVEWDYGELEGRTTPQIREIVPGLDHLAGAGPGRRVGGAGVGRGSTASSLAAVPSTVAVLLFGHGHSLRALAARWLELPVADGRHLRLDTSTVSVLGWERETPVVLRWNA